MNSGTARLALLTLILLGALATVRVIAGPLARITLSAAPQSRPSVDGVDSIRRAAPESVAAIVLRDPFRIDRRPAATAYDPLRLAESLAPRPPRPTLVLAGIVEGVQPSAVVEGFPGIDGSRVVRIGDIVSGLRVKSISKSGVVIVGLDTSWALQVREPWKN